MRNEPFETDLYRFFTDLPPRLENPSDVLSRGGLGFFGRISSSICAFVGWLSVSFLFIAGRYHGGGEESPLAFIPKRTTSTPVSGLAWRYPHRLTLDKMNHFVDTRKVHCPFGAGFRAVDGGELSTK
jgi:hypothetical protein